MYKPAFSVKGFETICIGICIYNHYTNTSTNELQINSVVLHGSLF